MDVTLVIPVLNEESSLPRLLTSIQKQTLAPAEIIFVDAASTDGTQQVIRMAAQGDARIRLLIEPGATPGRGRNKGIEAAAHEWIALTDAGIELEPDWLQELVAALARMPEAGVVYGNFGPRIESHFAQCLALTYVPALRQTDAGRMRGHSIASSLVKRDRWQAAGRFPDLRAAEDRIFMERLQEIGIVKAWAPNASLKWDLPGSLSKVFRRFESYSMHNVVAGRQKDWHHGVAKIYLAGMGMALLGLYLHPAFWFMLLALWLARGAKSIVERREDHSLLWCFRPDRLLAVCLLLIWIDLATFAGWIHGTWRNVSSSREVY